MKNEIKEIITESVLGFLNKSIHAESQFPELGDEQKKEIEEIIKKNINRPGLLGFTYGTNIEENKTSFGIRVDPTANDDWVLSKEEILYEIDVKYNNSLHKFVKEIRKKLAENKND